MALPSIVATSSGRGFFDYARDEFFNPLGIPGVLTASLLIRGAGPVGGPSGCQVPAFWS
jgi:CubicO group peptidase (beta-lactamase class C family)